VRFSTSWLISFAILLLAGCPEDNGGDARTWQVVATENPAALVSGWGVRATSPTGTSRPVVGGDGTQGDDGDGRIATEALLDRPPGIEWTPPNTLYVADTGNRVIRRGHLP